MSSWKPLCVYESPLQGEQWSDMPPSWDGIGNSGTYKLKKYNGLAAWRWTIGEAFTRALTKRAIQRQTLKRDDIVKLGIRANINIDA